MTTSTSASLDPSIKQNLKGLVEDEIARNEIRQILEVNARDDGHWHSVWRVLNSNFIIWFLSTVLIGLATWLYTSWSQEQAEQLAAVQRLEHLKTEILYRLDVDPEAVPTYPDRSVIQMLCFTPDQSSAPRILDIGRGISRDPADGATMFEPGRFVFPDFQDRSTFSLLWEYERLVPFQFAATVQNLTNLLKEMKQSVVSGQSTTTTAEYLERIAGLTASW